MSSFKETVLGMDKMGEMNQKDKILKLMTFIKLYSTMKILKEDNKPVELVDNLYIGSIGAAHNKKALKESGITHIVIAASGLKQLFPEEFKYLKFEDIKNISMKLGSSLMMR